MNGHSIHIAIGPGALEAVEFRCHEPDTADCRNVCREDECEEGCIHYMAHRRNWKPLDYCNKVTWLDNSGTWEEMYDGPVADVHCGPIDINWDSLGYSWRYAS